MYQSGQRTNQVNNGNQFYQPQLNRQQPFGAANGQQRNLAYAPRAAGFISVPSQSVKQRFLFLSSSFSSLKKHK